MCYRPSAQSNNPEIGAAVDEPAILRAERKVVGEVIVHSSPIEEGGFRLASCSQHGRSSGLRRSESQCSGACENVRIESCRTPGKVHYPGSRGLVHIRL